MATSYRKIYNKNNINVMNLNPFKKKNVKHEIKANDYVTKEFVPANNLRMSYASYLQDFKNSFTDVQLSNISTVMICCNINAKVLARLPLNVYQEINGSRTVDKNDYRYFMLHYKPNGYSTKYNFIHHLGFQAFLNGNSFAYINRQQGLPKSLKYIKLSDVQSYGLVDEDLWWRIKGFPTLVHNDDLIHITGGPTRDMIWGKSILEVMRLNLEVNYKAMKTIDNHYENDSMSTKALKSTIESESNLEGFKQSFEEFKEDTKGFTKIGPWVRLPFNTEVQELEMKVNDALFLGTVKFTAGQIGSWYGIPPSLYGQFEASKWNNVEAMQLDFKSNTIADIAKNMREEFQSKLLSREELLSGKSIEFNLDAMVELDTAARMNKHKALFSIGAITPNRVAQIEGEATYPEGDYHFVPLNQGAIENISPSDSSIN